MKNLGILQTALLLLVTALWNAPEPVSAQGENPGGGEFPIRVLRVQQVPGGEPGEMVVETEVITRDAPPGEFIFYQDGEVRRVEGEALYQMMEGLVQPEEEFIAQKSKKNSEGGGDKDYKKFFQSMNIDPNKSQKDDIKKFEKFLRQEKDGDSGKDRVEAGQSLAVAEKTESIPAEEEKIPLVENTERAPVVVKKEEPGGSRDKYDFMKRSYPSSGGRETSFSSLKGFEPYKLVLERNIFDPNRRRYRPQPPKPAATPRPPPPPLDYINLTGAIVSKKNEETTSTEGVAFFRGSRSEYSVALTEGMEIAGFRLGEIRTDRVKLVKDDRQVDLFVGKSLGGREKEEWQLHDGPRPEGASSYSSYRSYGSGSSGSSTVSQSSGSSSESSGNTSDLLRKLLERRRQEMGQ